MKIQIKSIAAFFIAMLFLLPTAFSQDPATLVLYTSGVPNSKEAPAGYAEKPVPDRISMVTDPTLTIFLPAKENANGTAVLICPGGAYAFLAIDHEGYAVAKKFNEIGIAAFVLKYRLPNDQIMPDKSIGPLQDAQRALQIIRKRAGEWNINPSKVGIMGFSAGGHLASTAGTHFNNAVIDNPDNISLRPDFMMLIYPVITMGELTHKGSKLNLLGAEPNQQQIELYSNEKHVTADTPPTFIMQAEDDKTVPVQNGLMFYEALLKAGAKAEMHLYQSGGHGFGLNNKSTNDYWFDRLKNWLQVNALL
jgi:acetyl esterase/lipase